VVGVFYFILHKIFLFFIFFLPFLRRR
jgi:hypothetical protein